MIGERTVVISRLDKVTKDEEKWIFTSKKIETPEYVYYRNNMWDNVKGQGNKYFFAELDTGIVKIGYRKCYGGVISGDIEIPEVGNYASPDDSWETIASFVIHQY